MTAAGSASRTPSLAEVIRVALERRLTDVSVSMPGLIHDYDPATQTATVQPCLRRPEAQPNGVDAVPILPTLQRVPVVFPGSGIWRMNFPVNNGDSVLLVFSDRSLGQWKNDGSEGDPLIGQHELTDAIAIVGLVPPGAPRAVLPNDRITIGSDGGAIVEILANAVNITAGSVTVNTTGNATVNAGGEIDLNGTLVKLNGGSLPIARVGDQIVGNAGPFPIVAVIGPPGNPTVLG